MLSVPLLDITTGILFSDVFINEIVDLNSMMDISFIVCLIVKDAEYPFLFQSM